ncbi:MAG TPA: DNA-directed RNA polymerase subunit omega [Myxococcota bacterium]|nr:DNA-directed RNA polymerase subunit omega [Myxococcota bacterium]
MARVTVEDCLQHIENHFSLVILAAKRVRQIKDGARAMVVCDNKPAIAALREIAQGKVQFTDDIKTALPKAYAEHFAETRPRLPVT